MSAAVENPFVCVLSLSFSFSPSPPRGALCDPRSATSKCRREGSATMSSTASCGTNYRKLRETLESDNTPETL